MNTNGIDLLGLDRVLKRGSGEVIVEWDNAMILYDRISEAYFLVCDDIAVGLSMYEQFIGQDCHLLMVSNCLLGNAIFHSYDFSEKLECYQVAYYGEKPLSKDGLDVRVADERDLEMLIENYHLISPEELERVVKRRSILLGYDKGSLVGFIGEHLEGSIGILYIFPEYRHRGFAIALQKHLIAKTMDEGYIPFGQVEKENQASLNLQKKIGMTQSENLIVWMWK